MLAAAAALCSCTAVPRPTPAVEVGAQDAGFDGSAVRTDLESSARMRFGEALVTRALAAETHLFAKHYFGLAPPPVRQPDGSFKDPEPPTAMLIREDGRWMAAAVGGLRAVADDKAAAIDAAIADPAFWNEPVSARATCTDAGASLLLLRTPKRQALVRKGTCGATQRTERLIFAALNA
jgi:hypothetical protein